MIERYRRAAMAAVWEPEARFRRMLEVEAAFLEELAPLKGIPRRELEALRRLLPGPWRRAVERREARGGHDVLAFLEEVSARLKRRAPRLRRYLHYGLTSSDILDTALAGQLRDAAGLLISGVELLRSRVRALALRHGETWLAGRTHGRHAEPITLAAKLAGWHAELGRSRARLERAREEVSYGKLSGAVGTFSQIPESLEVRVCRRLGLKPEPAATQVVGRDRHAAYLQALALTACAIERFALQIRLLQQSEVAEAFEPFGASQKGSSAMPHKRNPVLCENLCGLARLVRAWAAASLENVALWHERDISHSSLERVALPDASLVTDFMLGRFEKVLAGLSVDAARMRRNLAEAGGFPFSQRVLLALVDAGLERGEAYGLVREAALACRGDGGLFREALARDARVAAALGPEGLARCFELGAYRTGARALLKRTGILSARGGGGKG